MSVSESDRISTSAFPSFKEPQVTFIVPSLSVSFTCDCVAAAFDFISNPISCFISFLFNSDSTFISTSYVAVMGFNIREYNSIISLPCSFTQGISPVRLPRYPLLLNATRASGSLRAFNIAAANDL